MDREELKKLLPHREPMLLLDEAASDGEEATASYTVRGDEFFLQGHFPGNPVVPGVILCEMMGQSACVLIQDAIAGATPYFTGMDNIKFKNKVLPGDKVVLKSRITKARSSFYFIKSEGFVEDRLCVSGDLSFALVR
ncbi:MAG: beta-hydroxyacyl-ACP dehydratase [Clostridiales bacterium]|nr:beta-hydroxyacyl-ACP dehydratase [Clostridiales bacterium]